MEKEKEKEKAIDSWLLAKCETGKETDVVMRNSNTAIQRNSNTKRGVIFIPGALR